MLGQRLVEANRIARRRYLRWFSPFENLDRVQFGRLRRSNGTCDHIMCKSPRYRGKGFRKRRQKEMRAA